MEGQELPVGWEEAPIGVFCMDIEQRVPGKNEKFFYIDIGSVDRNTKAVTGPTELLGIGAPSRARKCVLEGDVLVSMTRPNLNAVALVPPELDGHIASTGFDVLRCPDLDCRWLYFLVRTKKFVEIMSGLVQGALYPAVKAKDIRSFVVPVAPINEQRRITASLETTLAAVDACRQRLDGVAAILKRFRQAVLAAATSGELTREWREDNPIDEDTGDNEVASLIEKWISSQLRGKTKIPAEPDLSYWTTEIPQSWHLGSVSMVAECLDSQRIPVKKDKRSAVQGTYPYYGANGIVDMVDEYIFDGELVLVTEDETFYGREKPIAYRSSGKCWVNNHAHVLRPEDAVAADYLCYCLMHYPVLPWLTGTTGRAKLTQGVLNSLPVAIPPRIEMERIVSKVQELFTLADQLEAKLTAARKLVDRLTPALLAKAFRGELVPQDPNDEPASVLLERIRAARQAEAAGGKPSRRGRRKAAASPGQAPLAAAPAPSDLLAQLLQECGALSERALLAASELDPAGFRAQLALEQGMGMIRETAQDGQVLLEAASTSMATTVQ